MTATTGKDDRFSAISRLTGLTSVKKTTAERAGLIAERDQAINERDVALAERDVAMAERDRMMTEVESVAAELTDAQKEGARAKRAYDALRSSCGPFAPGHYYSPIPNFAEVEADAERFWPTVVPETLPGIDLRVEQQIELLDRFADYAAEIPFADEPTRDLRYGFKNGMFASSDGTILYCMMRLFRPAKIIEVGSGWSSALMLDVVERHGGTELVFIEPHTERLNSLLRPEDTEFAKIINAPLNEVGPDVIRSLKAGDFLFIDSTHVAKIGSDVNELLLDVIPSLPAGVTIHVHDIGYPFEYARAWLREGRAWNEAYMLRALLTGNERIQILWFSSYMDEFHSDRVVDKLPTWKTRQCGSIWLRTI